MAIPSPKPRTPAVLLSQDTAFVVHVAPGDEQPDHEVCGRAEHVASGRHARFHSASELARFMRLTLNEESDR